MLDVKFLEAEIRDQYFIDDNNRPWIIGFSGGKDSTMLLQIVWNAIKYFPPEIRQMRQIFVVCNNTLVENPKILDYTNKVLKSIEKAAVEQDMPLKVQRTIPKLEDTFWLNLIGRGYPAPNNIFRWCTERLKISPTTKFILETVNENGEAILLLGTREEESSNRAKNMRKHERIGQRLRKHVLPNTYVFAPLKDVTTNEVWQYLLQVPSPWGASNRDLVTLYRNATGGDCPLVIDTTTPSCGQSRFGCWVCTVVNKDKSMTALIDNGEEWMLPLLEIRDLLAISRDSDYYRDTRRRDGTEKSGVLGPYRPWFRAKILEEVLKAQKAIQEEEPETSLISYQELVAIQILWYRDSIFDFRVSDTYNNIFNSNAMKPDKLDEQKQKENEILKEVCSENANDIPLINELLSLQKSKILLRKKRGLSDDLEQSLEQFLKKQL
ncbi:DNA phosphorothioation system sulfurtransferase DndC [Haliscomenobacter hydrossis]|uniref:Sulfurtransferase DndC n=1 Tax=Haliscomenobacter hydrossis (strain ATCC 27775 / DSM 1100 / LMG 10767 / O) TaxID=760192 RepID=F4L4C6_HALH1|nr:DNA phosphorothioation system sulfurtransferase DndC [Haliscomenobacter hydrossis]AEE51795.1 sulfurtransferase DndC [Haliscomenobacter hydrossis DSM 1100]